MEATLFSKPEARSRWTGGAPANGIEINLRRFVQRRRLTVAGIGVETHPAPGVRSRPDALVHFRRRLSFGYSFEAFHVAVGTEGSHGL